MFSGRSTQPDAAKTGFETGTFFLLLALFLGSYLAVYLEFCGSLHRDESDQIIFSQGLALGYHEQPPLYSWLTWAFFRVLGPNLVTLALLKTLILGLIYSGLHRNALHFPPSSPFRRLGRLRAARFVSGAGNAQQIQLFVVCRRAVSGR